MNTFTKYLFLVLILASFSGTMYAQNSVVDSLKSRLSSHVKKDTTKVKLISSLLYQIYDVNISEAETLLKEAEELSNTLNFTVGKADVNYYKAHIALLKSKYANSIDYFNQALELYKSTANKKGIARTLNSIGTVYYYQGDFSNALKSYEESSLVYKALNNLNGLAINLNNIANIYADQGNYFQSIKKHKESIIIKEKTGSQLSIAKSYTNIGGIYGELHDFPNATENLNKALAIYDSIGNNKKNAMLLVNIGILHKKQNQNDKALEYYYRALKISEKQKNQKEIADCLSKIANIYKEQGLNSKAIDHFQEALTINQKINNKIGESLSYFGLAECYYIDKQYNKSLDYILKVQKNLDNLKLLNLQKGTFELLSNIYEKLGDDKKSLLNHRKFKVLSDSLLDKEVDKKIIRLEYDYKYKEELESANKKVETTTKDLQKSKYNLLLGIITFLGITLILVTIIFFLRLRNVNIKNQNILTEQKLLRSQMTPHFIFNALSVLQGIILNKEEEKSLSYLSKFSKLLRITLENSRDKIVSLDQELIAVENYLAMQNIKSNFSYEYTIYLDDSIDKRLFEIPPMLIQPFIENVIEHAFDKEKKELKIDISLKYLNTELICTIIDNGLGINSQKENTKKHKKSLATTITSERLTILSKDLKTNGSISIEDREKYNERGTIVTLVIPHKLKNL